jgi:hypothetical protein
MNWPIHAPTNTTIAATGVRPRSVSGYTSAGADAEHADAMPATARIERDDSAISAYAAIGVHDHRSAITLHVMSGTHTQWIALLAGLRCDSP